MITIDKLRSHQQMLEVKKSKATTFQYAQTIGTVIFDIDNLIERSISKTHCDVYVKDNKVFVKLAQTDIINEGAMHAFCGFELRPIPDDEKIIGDFPFNYSDEREFYNPLFLTFRRDL